MGTVSLRYSPDLRPRPEDRPELIFSRTRHLDASDRNCRSTQVTETKKTDVDDLFRVSIHTGLFCIEPPAVSVLPLIESSELFCLVLVLSPIGMSILPNFAEHLQLETHQR